MRLPAWIFLLVPTPIVSSFLVVSKRIAIHPCIVQRRTSLLLHHHQTQTQRKKHIVEGIECVEVNIDLVGGGVGCITVLEATAESQTDLVNMALEDDDDVGTETAATSLSSNRSLSLCRGDPYGAVLWPAASAVASYIMTNLTTSLNNCSVLELGAGTGLVSIAASVGGARSVIATDYEPIPLKLLDYAARNLNNPAGTSSIPIVTAHLDLTRYDTELLPPADMVVAADVMYEPSTGRALAQRVLQALQNGSRVIVGDSPGRAGRPAFLQELERLGVKGIFVPTTSRTCLGDRHELICGKESTSVSDIPKELTVDIMDLDPATSLR